MQNKISHLGLYICLAIVLLFLFILFSHFINYTKITNEPLNIIQSEQPIPEVIDMMLEKKQPIIFLYELELWDGIDLLIGYPTNEIADVLKDNNELIKTIKTTYLRPFNLIFTKDWKINLETKTDTWETLPIIPTKETSYGHFIANLSGLMMICLIHPNKLQKTGPSIAEMIKDNHNFKMELEKENKPEQNNNNENITADIPQVFDYITIPIRPSNMVYIPYGWYYWIYCGQSESYTTYLDIHNITWFG